MKKTPIDSKSAGKRNEKLILTLLQEHKILSQTELCRLVGIGSSTASTIVSRLREKGLVIESQGASTRRGPKPVNISINPQSAYVIAVEINPSYVTIGLFDFVGAPVDKTRLPLGADRSVDHVTRLLADNLLELVGRHAVEPGKVLGVGVALSGSVCNDGTVSLSSPLGWKNVPLRERLQSITPFHIFVYSTRVRLLAEIARNPQLASKNVLYLNVAGGVGSTFYSGGKLIFGSTGRYGEIGHTIVDPNGLECGCGHRGCLEAIISGPALAARIRRDVGDGRDSLLQQRLRSNPDLTPEEIINLWGQAIQENDAYALELREFVADHISRTVAAAINAYDPEVVLLGGYVCLRFPDYLIEKIRRAIPTSVYEDSHRRIEILSAAAGEEALISGVASAALQDGLDFAL